MICAQLLTFMKSTPGLNMMVPIYFKNVEHYLFFLSSVFLAIFEFTHATHTTPHTLHARTTSPPTPQNCTHILSSCILNPLPLTQPCQRQAHNKPVTNSNPKFTLDQSWLNPNQTDPINAIKHTPRVPKRGYTH